MYVQWEVIINSRGIFKTLQHPYQIARRTMMNLFIDGVETAPGT